MSKSNQRQIIPARRTMRGVTLLELIITVAVVAILAGLALPSYREFSTRMTVTENTNSLIGALNTARTEAAKRGRTVAVIANGGKWDDGWQVVAADETAAGVIEATPTSPGADASDCDAYMDSISGIPLCMRHRGALSTGYTLLGKGVGTGASDTQVVFGSTGALRAATAFDFSVCRPSGEANAAQSRRIHVSASGTIESRRDTTNAPAGSCS